MDGSVIFHWSLKSTLTSLIHQAKSIIWSGFDFMSAMLTFSGQDASYLHIIHIKAKTFMIGSINFTQRRQNRCNCPLRRLHINFRIKEWLGFIKFWCREDAWDARNLEVWRDALSNAVIVLRQGGLICRIPTSIYTLRFKNTSACTCIHSNFKAISCVKKGLMKQTLSLCCVCLQTRVLCSGGKFC